MNAYQIRNLEPPRGNIDVVLDTDAFNEIDDQFAIAYLLKSGERLNVKALYAAPFLNSRSSSPKDGMEKSYAEILKLLNLMGEGKFSDIVYRGSETYLPDETTPVLSPAARHLAALAEEYTPEHPLYVVEIAAITTVASAILLNPKIAENMVVVWLGGNSLDCMDTKEFNMMQDIAAARVIFKSGVPLVQLPCGGVVEVFRISKPEIEFWLRGKSALCDYLATHTIGVAEEEHDPTSAWTRVIWDVTAVAWLLNENHALMADRILPRRVPNYDFQYNLAPEGGLMCYVYHIDRDRLMTDLIQKLTQ